MDYPVLDTGARLQGSVFRKQRVHSKNYQFAGSGYQSQRASEGAGLSWRLQYDGLNAEETARLREFFATHGRAQTFAFRDPWTDDEFPQCRFARSGLFVAMNQAGRFQVQVEIENAKH